MLAGSAQARLPDSVERLGGVPTPHPRSEEHAYQKVLGLMPRRRAHSVRSAPNSASLERIQ